MKGGKKAQTRVCPKCGGVAVETNPQGLTALRGTDTFFTCTACGLMTNQDGKAVVKSVEEIAQINSIAAAARKTAEGVPEFSEMTKTSQALFQAKLAGLAIEMWMDGYKHGVLCHAVGAAYDERAKETQDDKQD